MKRNTIILVLLLCIHFLHAQLIPIIPFPNNVKLEKDSFKFSQQVKIVVKDTQNINNEIKWFNDLLSKKCGYTLSTSDAPSNEIEYIEFLPGNKSSNNAEHYAMQIQKNKISISANNNTGIQYALINIIELLPSVNKPSGNKAPKKIFYLPCLKIDDEPRFAWRGMHLDVSRHFASVDFIKKYIDLLALHKMNTFHWHLTDDQGWRIEIKKYPLLTKIGSLRKGSMIGPYKDQKFDSIPYSGFYTQENIKDIVLYAQNRHVTIVPEIEMPGHASAAIAAYPWLSCRRQATEVERGWGVFEDVLCTRDSTFNFIEDVLKEVIELFPGKYIHVGGDECPKTRWKVCKDCQARMKNEKLSNEHQLQSYFISKVEKWLNAHNKQLIGWDEILEGGLAPNAAVMSWRGTEGGITAAKSGHYVVMSPGSHCYFDHYQADPSQEPLAIGGFTPIEKVYDYDPVPNELSDSEKKFVMGAQANLWTEYMTNENQMEYMAYPRACALAEVLWTNKNNKNASRFFTNLEQHLSLLRTLNVNYSSNYLRVDQKIISENGNLKVELISSIPGQTIVYSKDDKPFISTSEKYTQAILITGKEKINACILKNNELAGTISTKTYNPSLSSACKVSIEPQASGSYPGIGSFTLVDGYIAHAPRKNDEWLGWSGKDVSITLQLKKLTSIQSVKIYYLQETLSWIYAPSSIAIAFSEDGKTWSAEKYLNKEEICAGKDCARFDKLATKAMYIKLSIKNFGKIPEGNNGAGSDAWLFLNEIEVN